MIYLLLKQFFDYFSCISSKPEPENLVVLSSESYEYAKTIVKPSEQTVL